MYRITDNEGLYLPDRAPSGSSRVAKADHVDFERMINLNDVDERGRLKYADLLEEFEDAGVFVDDLQGVISKYFDGSSRRIAFNQQFGTNNHAFYDY